jgi:type II secretory pathway predicted ATPase ExeA
LSPFAFLSYLCAANGMRTRRSKGETAADLLAFFRGLPKRTVLLIDEAHQLPDNSLEELRLLTTDHFDRQSPFALVFAGQPMLKDRLAEPQHFALLQRIGVRLRLRPLNENEVPRFLEQHLRAAGAKNNCFDSEATTAIFQHTQGIPRLIQNLALASMLLAMDAGKSTVDASLVQQAAVDWEAL